MIRKTQSLARISHRLYDQIISELPDHAILMLNVDGTILDCNRGAEIITQYERDQITGQFYGVLFPSGERDANIPKSMLEAAAAAGKMSIEGWRVKKGGMTFWASIILTAIRGDDGNVEGFAEFVQDLTDRKLAEDNQRTIREELKIKDEELRLSAKQFDVMIAEVQDYAIIVLDDTGHIRTWNAGAQLINGYTPDVIGQHFSIFHTPLDLEAELPQTLLREAKEKGKALHEGWRVRKDKSRFWGSIVITAIHDRTGKHIGFIKVTRDLTAKKLADDKLRNYAADLETRNRELEQFTYITSHDLQEPLRKIRTFAEVGRHNLEDAVKVRTNLEKIDDSAARMSALLRAIMEYTTLAQISTPGTTIDLNQVFQKAKAELHSVIKQKRAQVNCGTLPVVQGDPRQIRQLMVHILSNALKYNSRVPEISVDAEVVSRMEIVELPDYLTDPEYVQIRFADNGIGFEKQYARQIYDIFQRLHSTHQYPGTGIGLALCRRIVLNHRGHITATSTPGEGSVFFVYLPVPQGDS